MEFKKMADKFSKVTTLKEKTAQAKKMAEEALRRAQACLADEKFVDFRESYERARASAMAVLFIIDETETDPQRYTFRVKDVLTKIRYLDNLLSAVENKGKFAKPDPKGNGIEETKGDGDE